MKAKRCMGAAMTDIYITILTFATTTLNNKRYNILPVKPAVNRFESSIT